MPRPGDFALQIGHGGHPYAVDAQHDVPGLQSGGQRRARDVFDQQSALGVQFLLFVWLQRPQHQPQLAAAVLTPSCAQPEWANPPAAPS